MENRHQASGQGIRRSGLREQAEGCDTAGEAVEAVAETGARVDVSVQVAKKSSSEGFFWNCASAENGL